jgi:putative transposase
MGIKNKISNGNVYFLTMTIINWIDIFTKPVYKHIIIDSLNYCIIEKGLLVYGWCLMTNHLHMIASADNDLNLSDIIRDFKKHTSKAISEEVKDSHDGRKEWLLNHFAFYGKIHPKKIQYKVWQDGNDSKEIDTNDLLIQKLNYIHNNPVKAEFVNEPHYYKYSSAADYADMKGLVKIIII